MYFLCFYKGNARILQSFDRYDNRPTWHYCIVTWFGDLGVEKEVWINEKGSQIIFSEYIPKGKVIEYRQANCLPYTINKDDRINFYYRGVFRDGGTTYECLESHFAF